MLYFSELLKKDVILLKFLLTYYVLTSIGNLYYNNIKVVLFIILRYKIGRKFVYNKLKLKHLHSLVLKNSCKLYSYKYLNILCT